MAKILIIQIALLSLAMADQSCTNSSDVPNWWFPMVPVWGTFSAPSTPCLVRGEPVIRRPDYTYTPNIGGHKIHTKGLVWNEARLVCQREGGHLAVINSHAEAYVITELFKNSPPITDSPHVQTLFLGFSELYSPGQWVTIFDQSLSTAGFSEWVEGNPSGGDEHCGGLHEFGKLNDVNCDIKFGFVCELPFYNN